jgi:hypothetical protein
MPTAGLRLLAAAAAHGIKNAALLADTKNFSAQTHQNAKFT